ncbi:MAG: SMC family ATPase [Anaerolineae bacterium]
MLITRIELQNTKSYRDDVVTFTPGTNAICGENGAGKSTLLEAIGFVLFDYLPYNQSDFVREGEKTATIAVSFVSNQDGREYQVVRRCGRSSDYFVYDPELDARIVSGKVDVLDWTRDHLGVEPGADLTALFRDAVGVPQGLLTAPFLQTASQRKPLFDRLLRVDEYEQAWKALRETLRYLESKLAEHKETIARLEAQVQRLPGLRQRAQALRSDSARIEERLARLQVELEEAAARRTELEAVRQEMDRLAQQAETLTARLEGILEQLAAAEKGVIEAEAARATVEASQPGYEAYNTAQAAMAELEEKRRERDRLRDERAAQEMALKLAQERVKRLESELLEVEEAEMQMETLQTPLKRQEEYESALKTAEQEARALEAAEMREAERQARLADLRARLETLEAGLAEAVQVEADLHQARASLDEARKSLTGLQSEQAALSTEVRRLTAQNRTLEMTEVAQCPVCEQPLTSEHRASLLARNQQHLDELRSQDQALADKITNTTEMCSELEGRIQHLEAHLRELPRQADQEEFVEETRALEEELAHIQTEIEGLAGSRAEVTRLERALAELGDPRRQYERLAEKAAQRAMLEEQRETELHALSALDASLSDIEQALAPFADLDQRLAEKRAALDQHAEDHRRYLEYARIAEALADRRQQVSLLQAQQARLTAEHDEIQKQIAEIAAQFDPDAFAAAREREAGLQAERAGLQGRLSELQGQLTDTSREIEELEALERALAAEQDSLARHQDLLALTEFIREVIRQAGPYVTRRLMQQVSLEAARLFSEVMADYAARLRWEENYEIVLEKDGRNRSFQQLSGGEQMAAALSVRLALLRELSAIDVAFFDEPTSNLDDTRRDSLADQILSVKGFSQLFVISHDDTFERATHNIVRVRKEDGVSRVEKQ